MVWSLCTYENCSSSRRKPFAHLHQLTWFLSIEKIHPGSNGYDWYHVEIGRRLIRAIKVSIFTSLCEFRWIDPFKVSFCFKCRNKWKIMTSIYFKWTELVETYYRYDLLEKSKYFNIKTSINWLVLTSNFYNEVLFNKVEKTCIQTLS